MRAKLLGLDGKEVTSYDEPGELLIQSPSLALGYLNNERATAETFVHDEQGRWMKTGDEVIVTKAPSGNEHIVVVDRIKELIKVKVRQDNAEKDARESSLTSSGPPSRPRRVGSAPVDPPRRGRLRRDSGSRRQSRRGA